MWKRTLVSVGMLLIAGALGCADRNPNASETSAGNPATGRQANDQAQALPPLPDVALPGPLGPPPDLPKTSAGFQLPKEAQKKLDEAIAGYSADQVTSYLLLREVLDGKETLDEKQKEYLQRASTAIEKRAQDVLKRDLEIAVANLDPRAALLVLIAAKSLPGEIGSEASATLTTLKGRLLLGYPMKDPIFSVSKAKAEIVEGPYTEGSELTRDRITLTPKAGFQMVRITAEVENVSKAGDPGYHVWALGPLGRITAPFALQGSKPKRLADSSFAYAVPASGDWVPCAHVCAGCGAMRSMTITIEDQGMHFIGGYVAEGESFHLDLLFTLPENEKELRFVLLGAPPVRMTVAKPQATSAKKG